MHETKFCLQQIFTDAIFVPNVRNKNSFAPYSNFCLKPLPLNFAALRETSEEKSPADSADFRRCWLYLSVYSMQIFADTIFVPNVRNKNSFAPYPNFRFKPLPLNFAALRETIEEKSPADSADFRRCRLYLSVYSMQIFADAIFAPQKYLCALP
jgi:hypothetical protein